MTLLDYSPQMRLFSFTLFLLFVLLFKPVWSNGQPNTYSIINNNFFKRLSHSSLNYIPIRNTPDNGSLLLLPLKDKAVTNKGQILIFYHKRLYITIPSTGYLLESQILNEKSDSIHFYRIDSTELTGYNIGCFSFIYNDTVYNYGGYGFWRFNGQLRKYNKQLKEWDIQSTNKELPFLNEGSNAKIWFEPTQGKLMLLSNLTGNEAINNEKPSWTDSVFELNLKSKNWNYKGILNPYIYNSKSMIVSIGSLDKGLLILNGGEIEVWDLVNNKIYKINNAQYKQTLNSWLGHGFYTWMEGNKLFYTSNSLQGIIDSIEVKNNDLQATELTIYKEESLAKNIFIYFLLFSGIVFSIIYVVIEIKKRNKRSFSLIPTKEYNYDKRNNSFNELEKSIINTLIQKIETGFDYTVEDMNQGLGIKRKTIEIQKKIRTESINRINHKFNVIFDSETVFIERIRSREDRRFFNYTINVENIVLYKSAFKQN